MAFGRPLKILAVLMISVVMLSGCGDRSTPTAAPVAPTATARPVQAEATVVPVVTLVSVATEQESSGQEVMEQESEVVSESLPLSSPTLLPEVAALPTVTPTPSTLELAPTDLITPTVSAESVVNEAEPLPFAITLPPGFEIHYYAQGVINARAMALSPNGTLFVGTRSAGNVYALVDEDGDQQADQVITIASGLNEPNGVAFYEDALYVAEINRILRYDNIEGDLQNVAAPVVINQEYPVESWHGWKYLRFGPDGYLYVPVGAPCDVCEVQGLFGTITRLLPDGSGLEVYARGIRNTVGFDWDPLTQELWFTDNGPDALGDDIPPDELNHAPTAGLNFGFPACHAGTIVDPQFGQQDSCAAFTAPALQLGPHVAALGMRFYTGEMFPADYQNQVFIAEHGSQSRSSLIGYRVTLARIENNQAVAYEPFAEGWFQNGQILGRPVDVLVLPDGSLLVSDDTGNAIYRIHYQVPS
jgi:glucose/arabinose dehydrogenase